MENKVVEAYDPFFDGIWGKNGTVTKTKGQEEQTKIQSEGVYKVDIQEAMFGEPDKYLNKVRSSKNNNNKQWKKKHTNKKKKRKSIKCTRTWLSTVLMAFQSWPVARCETFLSVVVC